MHKVLNDSSFWKCMLVLRSTKKFTVPGLSLCGTPGHQTVYIRVLCWKFTLISICKENCYASSELDIFKSIHRSLRAIYGKMCLNHCLHAGKGKMGLKMSCILHHLLLRESQELEAAAVTAAVSP